MILVRSKSQGFIGVLVGTNAIPQAPKVVTPGPAKMEIAWMGVVLVDEGWVVAPLQDLVPVSPEAMKDDKSD